MRDERQDVSDNSGWVYVHTGNAEFCGADIHDPEAEQKSVPDGTSAPPLPDERHGRVRGNAEILACAFCWSGFIVVIDADVLRSDEFCTG